MNAAFGVYPILEYHTDKENSHKLSNLTKDKPGHDTPRSITMDPNFSNELDCFWISSQFPKTVKRSNCIAGTGDNNFLKCPHNGCIVFEDFNPKFSETPNQTKSPLCMY